MDPHLRDELEGSELHTFWQWLKGLWKQYGTAILVALLVVLVAWRGWAWWQSWTAQKGEEKARKINEADNPEAFYRAAQEYADDPQYQAFAFLQGAGLALDKANKPLGNLPGQVSPETRSEQLKSAEDNLRKVLGLTNAAAEYKAQAHLGLASVAEDKHDWAGAREELTQAKTEAETAHLTLIAAQAAARLNNIERLQRPVVFGPEPVPATAPAPTSQSATTQPAASQATTRP
jgi:predicted negative regulator of RcsB-dependent stress response